MSNILGNMPPVFGSGYRGVVPAPSASDVSAQNILRADGTWGAQATSGPLPSQTGNAAKLLTTDGTNASWASSLNTFQFGDVTLGASGPSVKSTLSARAPRQGLVFDGTAGATVASVPAFGTGDFTVIVFTKADTIPSGGPGLIGGNGSSFSLRVDQATNKLLVTKVFVSDTGTSTSTITLGKYSVLSYRRSSGQGYFGINGKEDLPITDTTDYSVGVSTVGQLYPAASASYIWNGSVVPLIYNRALSASEVVALYEAGAPAGADYNSASNTNAATNWINSGVPYTTFSGGSATGFTATSNGVGNQIAAISPSTFPIVKGTKWRVTCTLTLNSGTAPSISFGSVGVNNLASNIQQLSAGSNTFELTVTQTTSTSTLYCYNLVSASNFSISGFSLTPLGLLLAPDAAQAGGGLVWYDTSGNAANITLPASGVSWNVPSSAKVATGWAFGGDVGIGTTSPTAIGSSRVTQINSTTGNTSFLLFSTNSTLNGSLYANASETSLGSISSIPLLFKTADVEKARIFANGNFGIGTGPTDGGQKLQVSGTAAISGVATFSDSVNLGASGVYGQLTFGGGAFYLKSGSSFPALYLDAYTAMVLRTNNGTTALTLDSSQNATFAGNGQIGANYTVAQKKLEIIGGSYADGQTLRLADYSTAYGFDIVNDGINAKLKVVRHSNSVGGTEAISVSRDAALTTFEGAIAIADGMTAPSATSGVAKIYVDTADGDLKVIFGDGTVKTIVTD